MAFPSVLPAARSLPADAVPALRWGISGPGWIAERFVSALQREGRQQVVAIEGRDIARARAFAERFAIPGAYAGDMAEQPDIDIVYVATPHPSHHGVARAALAAGKHVLVEKPLALSEDEAADLAALAARSGLFLMEAFWNDFLPKFDVIRQLLQDGALGPLRTVIARHGEHFPPDHRIMRPELAGGPLNDLGSYCISLAVQTLGEPERISGIAQAAPSGVLGQIALQFVHAGGAQSSLHTTLFSSMPNDAILAGDAAVLTVPGDFYAPGPFTLRGADGRTLAWDEPTSRYDQLVHEANHAAWCIGTGRTQSPIRPLSATIAVARTMDRVRTCLGAGSAA